MTIISASAVLKGWDFITVIPIVLEVILSACLMDFKDFQSGFCRLCWRSWLPYDTLNMVFSLLETLQVDKMPGCIHVEWNLLWLADDLNAFCFAGIPSMRHVCKEVQVACRRKSFWVFCCKMGNCSNEQKKLSPGAESYSPKNGWVWPCRFVQLYLDCVQTCRFHLWTVFRMRWIQRLWPPICLQASTFWICCSSWSDSHPGSCSFSCVWLYIFFGLYHVMCHIGN